MGLVLSVKPSDFPATKVGYKSYVKALGFEYDGSNYNPNVISYANFQTVERRSLEEVVDSELEMLNTRMYNEAMRTGIESPILIAKCAYLTWLIQLPTYAKKYKDHLLSFGDTHKEWLSMFENK